LNKAAISSLDAAQRSMQESRVLMTLRHKNIIKLLSCEETPHHLVWVCELMEGGDLHQYLVSRGPTAADARLADADAKMVFSQLVEGLSYAHMRRILHRDLKLENIFLRHKGSLVDIKIGDFGLADVYVSTATQQTTFDGFGTPYILPPEVFDATWTRAIGPEFDVWALGVCLYALLYGRVPFGGPTLHTRVSYAVTKQLIVAGHYVVDDTEVGPHAHDLVAKMLCPSPAQRVTVADIVAHPWLHAATPDSPPVSPGVRLDPVASTTSPLAATAPAAAAAAAACMTARDSIDDLLSATTTFSSTTTATATVTSGRLLRTPLPRGSPSPNTTTSDDRRTNDGSSNSRTGPTGALRAAAAAGHHTQALVDELDKSVGGLGQSALRMSCTPSPITTVGLDIDALTGSIHGGAADEAMERSEHGTARLVGRLKPQTWKRIDEDAEYDEGTDADTGSATDQPPLVGIVAVKPVARRRLTAPEIAPDRFAVLSAAAARAGGGGGGGSDRRHSITGLPRNRSHGDRLYAAGASTVAKTAAATALDASQHGERRPSATGIATIPKSRSYGNSLYSAGL
jgi:hypothetical protein